MKCLVPDTSIESKNNFYSTIQMRIVRDMYLLVEVRLFMFRLACICANTILAPNCSLQTDLLFGPSSEPLIERNHSVCLGSSIFSGRESDSKYSIFRPDSACGSMFQGAIPVGLRSPANNVFHSSKSRSISVGRRHVNTFYIVAATRGESVSQPARPSKRPAQQNAGLKSRKAAVGLLLRIENEGAFSNKLSGSVADEFSAIDRRFITNLIGSVTRDRLRLDFTIDYFLKSPNAVDQTIRQILRLAVYELINNGLPAHAIDVYVELSKDVNIGAARLVNGVLRSFLRKRAEGTLPFPSLPEIDATPSNFVMSAAVATSHPQWMVASWLQQYGPEDTLRILQHNNEAPVFGVRILKDEEKVQHHLQNSNDGIATSKYLPQNFIRVKSGLHSLLSEFSDSIQVQDEAAALVVEYLDPKPGDEILDCCAAPGGKTLLTASKLNGLGHILAIDIHEKKLAPLRREAVKQGTSKIIYTIGADFVAYAKTSTQQFDKVLIDAPCSGTGVMSKRADLRWRRTPQDIEQLVKLQDALLDAAVKLVKPGGVLVYSTCSIENAENWQRIEDFLKRHPNFMVQPPNDESRIPSECLDGRGCLAMLPHIHKTDGAFAAKLIRRLTN